MLSSDSQPFSVFSFLPDLPAAQQTVQAQLHSVLVITSTKELLLQQPV